CIGAAAINVLMDFVLVPAYGINGSALATVIAYGTGSALVLGLAQQRLGARVATLGLLTAPVVLVCLAFFGFGGLWFYAVAGTAALVTVVALSRAFGLFRGWTPADPFALAALETELAGPRTFRGWL